MKKQINVLAWLHIVICGGLLSALLIEASISRGSLTHYALSYIVPLVVLPILVLGIPGLIGGIGLLSSQPWARIVILVTSAFCLLLVPVGTALGFYGFWVLLSPEAGQTFGAPAQQGMPIIAALPPAKRNLLMVMAGTAATLFLLLKLGFLLSGDQEPAPIAGPGPAAVAVLILLAGIVNAVTGGIDKIHCKRAWIAGQDERVRKAHEDAIFYRQQRLKELAEHPDWAGPGVIVEQEDLRAGLRPYWLDTGSSVLCPHLHEVENVLNAHGISLRLSKRNQVYAHCRVEYAEFNRYLGRPPVYYNEFYGGDPDRYEQPTAYIICDEHKQIIRTVHVAEPSATDAPWFP